MGVGFAVLCLTALPTNAQSSWSARVDAMEQKYFYKNQKAEAIADLQDAVEKSGNDYTTAQCNKMLAMLKEYFGQVSPDINRFINVVYAMYRGANNSRIDHIVTYFQGQGSLYTAAQDARRQWFAPHHAVLTLAQTQINVNGSTTFKIDAKNDEGFNADESTLDVTTEDPTIARVEGDKIVGLRAEKTMVIVTNPQGMEMDKKEIEVLPTTTLVITPPTLKMTEGEEHQFTVTANKLLEQGALDFQFDPAQGGELKVFPVAPNSKEQLVEVTGLIPSLDDYQLKVTGPENSSTFAIVRVNMAEPHKPGMKWQLGGSGVVALSFLWAFSSQSDANDKRAAEEACVQESFTACEAEHQAYTDAQNTANIAWTVTALATVGTGYLWYRYYKNIKVYNGQMDEYKKYASVDLDISPTAVAVNVRF